MLKPSKPPTIRGARSPSAGMADRFGADSGNLVVFAAGAALPIPPFSTRITISAYILPINVNDVE